ncbi:MAG: hypothetical protein WAQ28_15945 [Bacteroidia bacterium]
MKKFFLPRITAVSLALCVMAGTVVLSTTGCGGSKPGCGSKHQHKVRAKKVKRMAPGMTM